MKTTIRTIPMALVAVTLGMASAAHAQTANSVDCNAARPPVASPGLESGDAKPGVVPRDSLSEKLATCGSVLNPPAVGDRDIVQPAPAIDDPLAIHPRDPQLKKN